jgi:hypothetical protein
MWRLFRTSCDKTRAAAAIASFGVGKSLEVTYSGSFNDQFCLRYIYDYE